MIKLIVFILVALTITACSNSFNTANGPNTNQLQSEAAPASEPPAVEPPPPVIPTPAPSPAPTPPPSTGKPTNGTGGTTGNIASSCSFGGVTRNFTLHVPTSYNASQASALVVAMHGLGDTHQNFNNTAAFSGWHSAADQKNFIFMVPASTNPNRESFLYFNANMSPNTTAIIAEADSLLECIYRGVGAKYNIETNQIYWIGFSEGASFVTFMANFFSEQIKSVAVYGGSAPRVASAVKRLIPVYFLAGTSDFNFSAISTQSSEWNSHPNKRDFVNASHSFSQLNSLVSPVSVWVWLSTVASEPVKSSF